MDGDRRERTTSGLDIENVNVNVGVGNHPDDGQEDG